MKNNIEKKGFFRNVAENFAGFSKETKQFLAKNKKAVSLALLSALAFDAKTQNIIDNSRAQNDIANVNTHVLITNDIDTAFTPTEINYQMYVEALHNQKCFAVHKKIDHILSQSEYTVTPFNDSYNHGDAMSQMLPFIDTFNQGNSSEDFFTIYSNDLPGTTFRGAWGEGFNGELISSLDAGANIPVNVGYVDTHEKGHGMLANTPSTNLTVSQHTYGGVVSGTEIHIPSGTLSPINYSTTMAAGALSPGGNPYARRGMWTVEDTANTYLAVNGGTDTLHFTDPYNPTLFKSYVLATELSPLTTNGVQLTGTADLVHEYLSTTSPNTVHHNPAPAIATPAIGLTSNGDYYVQNPASFMDSFTNVIGTNLKTALKYELHAVDTANTNISLGKVALNDTISLSDINVPSGLSYIAFVVWEFYGNSLSSISSTFNTDTTAPNVITQAYTVYLDSTGTATISPNDINNGTNDPESGIDTMWTNPATFTCMAGTTTATLYATNGVALTSSATTNITKMDTLAPWNLSATANISRDLNGGTAITLSPSDFNFSATDNCPVIFPTINGASSISVNTVGTFPVTLTMTDFAGNSRDITVNYTLSDTVIPPDVTNPTAITQNTTIYLNNVGNASITAADINNGSFDNVGGSGVDTIYLDNYNYSCSDTGANTVTMTVVDSAGNFDNATATVNVLDTISPNIAGNNYSFDMNGQTDYTVDVTDFGIVATDNCSISNIEVVGQNTFSTLGNHNVVFKVSDSSGNEEFITLNLNLYNSADITPPIADAKTNDTIFVNENGDAAILATDLDINSTDNIGITNMTVNPANFDCSELGVNSAVFEVSDLAGNTATQNVVIYVSDTLKPQNTTDETIVLDIAGQNTVSLPTSEITGTDNCDIDDNSKAWSVSSFNAVGTYSSISSISDFSGNEATKEATIIVENSVGINDVENFKGFQAYPTEDGQKLIIETGENNIKEIFILNLLGQKVFNSEKAIANNKTAIYNISKFSKGLYFLKAKNENDEISVTKKFRVGR